MKQLIFVLLLATICLTILYCNRQEYTYSDNVTDNITVSDNVTEWRGEWEIREWVKSTGIPDKRYIRGVYDCNNFAIDLWKAALAEGKPVGLFTQIRYRDGKISDIHMMNFTFKGNYAYQIEPQTGNVGPLAGYNVTLD